MKFRSTSKAVPGQPPAPPAAPKRAKAARSGGDGKKSGGRAQFVLLIGDEGAILVFMQGATVVRRLFAVSPQPDHTGAMIELLQSHPKASITILADVIDQQYVRHSFPPVSALSVSNLVKRRIERDFQSEDITGSIRLGRDKTGRKEWQYLLIALANTPMLQQWLDLIVEQPNEFKGIYLTPVEGQQYIARLHNMMTSEKPLPWQLLVSHHKVSGFRQIVLRNGKLVFTRATQAIDDAMPAVIAGNIEQEIMNTLEYLRRLGFAENNALEMFVVASGDVKEALDIRRFQSGQGWVLTPLDIADALGLEQAALSADRFGDVVMAAAFARAKKRELKLMTAYGAKLAQLYAARIGIKLLGALAALALLGMGAMNLLAGVEARSGAKSSEAERQPLQAQLESVRKSIGGLNQDVAMKSAIMLTYDSYLKDGHLPDTFLAKFAPLLKPEVRVRKFSWGPPGSAISASGAAAPAAGNPAATGAPVEVQAEMEFIGPFADVEALSKYVEGFLSQMRLAMTDYDIVHSAFPWQNQQDSNLEISFDQQQVQTPAVQEGQNRITFTFRGPLAGNNASNPGAPTGDPMMGGM